MNQAGHDPKAFGSGWIPRALRRRPDPALNPAHTHPEAGSRPSPPVHGISGTPRSPSSSRSRAATMPVRPSPPRQWTKIPSPAPSRRRGSSPARSQVCSKGPSGTQASAMGRCHQCRPAGLGDAIAEIRHPQELQFLRRHQGHDVLESQSSSACRSVSRSRYHAPVWAWGPCLPGKKVGPSRPPTGPEVSISNGCPWPVPAFTAVVSPVPDIRASRIERALAQRVTHCS